MRYDRTCATIQLVYRQHYSIVYFPKCQTKFDAVKHDAYNRKPQRLPQVAPTTTINEDRSLSHLYVPSMSKHSTLSMAAM